MNGTLNLNAAECLRDVATFGSTQIYNVCSGSVSTVPWGLSEWALTVLLTLLALLMAGLFAMLIMIARAA